MRDWANGSRLSLFFCVAVLAVTGLSAQLTKKVVYTGDEPRYLLPALSLALEGVPVMSQSRYEELRAAHPDPLSPIQYPFPELQPVNAADVRAPQHPIFISLLLAPLAPTWSIEIIRLLPFAIGLTGLCFLAVTLVRQTSHVLSALACFVPAAFCFPALPYHFLALPEIFLFTLSAVTFWNLCSGPREKISGYTPAILCSCLAPVVHLRGLALFAATAFYLAYLLRRAANWRLLGIVASIFLGALIAFIISNAFLGDWLGRVKDRPIWKAQVFAEMFVHYRYGLLPYAPIWVLAFAGLIAGLRGRKPWALPALVFFPVFLIGSAHWIGETYPGRFWVQTVPVLALCLSGFTEGVMRPAMKAILYLPLIALSLANSIVFLVDPGVHIAARSGAMPYDFLFKLLPVFHFGFWLDVPDSSLVRLGAISFCALIAGIVAAASIVRSTIVELAGVLLLVIGLEAHRVRPVPILTAIETNAVVVRMAPNEEAARRPLRLRFLAPWKEVGPRPDESLRPFLEVSDGDIRWRMPIMSGSLLVHKSAAPANDFNVALRWSDRDPMPLDKAAPGAEFSLLACNSVFARFW